MQSINTRLGNIKINDKFNTLLIVAFLVGIVLSGIALSNVIYKRAETQVAVKAELLMQTMDSIRVYTQDYVNPLLNPKLRSVTDFIPPAIPTFAVREVSHILNKTEQYKDFEYKDATLNPTNPLDLADDFEAEIVNWFKSTSEDRKTGFRETENGRKFYTARPFIVKEKRCLECHSDPKLAPKSLIATYGENGFGWSLNEVVAAQMIYVPAEDVLNNAKNAFARTITLMIGIFVSVIWLINFLLKKVVIARIRKIANTANAISMGDMSSSFEEESKDEIGLLAIAFERMRASLLIAMDMLNQNQSKD